MIKTMNKYRVVGIFSCPKKTDEVTFEVLAERAENAALIIDVNIKNIRGNGKVSFTPVYTEEVGKGFMYHKGIKKIHLIREREVSYDCPVVGPIID